MSRLSLSPLRVLVFFPFFFNLCSNLVLKLQCGRCNASYYGETCQHSNVRVGEHLGVSLSSGKKLKAKGTTALKDRMLFRNYVVSVGGFNNLARSNSEFHPKIKEGLLIWHDKPELNRNLKSLPFTHRSMYSRLNTLFATIVSLFHCNF